MILFKSKKTIMACLVIIFTTGCTSIGQPELSCHRLEKGGICAGPLDIYELTNNRETLEGLTLEELDKQVNKKRHVGHGHNSEMVNKTPKDEVVVYKERTLEQHDPLNYQKPEAIPQTRFKSEFTDGFGSWPNNGEPLAPEALAVISEPEAMRIQVFTYKDDQGNLKLPGYIYVETQARTWGAGRDANLRPSRVIPLEMARKSQANMQRVQQSRQGVDGLGVNQQGDK